jgi:hypothetical protein
VNNGFTYPFAAKVILAFPKADLIYSAEKSERRLGGHLALTGREQMVRYAFTF